MPLPMKTVSATLFACLLVPGLSTPSAGAPRGDEFERIRGNAPGPTLEDRQIHRAQAMQELLRARAHVLLAEQGGSSRLGALCPATGGAESPGRFRAKRSEPRQFVARYAPPVTRWATVAPPAGSASTVFDDYVSTQVVQSRCVRCHVEGGQSDFTRLVFVPASGVDYRARNLGVFEAFVATVSGGADIILDKIRGVSHGGSIQVPSGTTDFANMERFLRLLDNAADATLLSPDTLFNGITMAPPARTLRRAALVFAGRIPMQLELDSVADGSANSLRRAIRQVMEGMGFHEFLIRAANDRLLTDRHLSSVFDLRTEVGLVDVANLQWREARKSIDRGYDRADDDPSYATWDGHMQFGIARAPLELIAHVVENDLPYTEILTADYIMANPLAAKGYGASTRFDVPVSQNQFRPSQIVNYFRNDFSKVSEFDVRYGTRILNSGGLATNYPHAGILNTRVYLRRYPTTASNRNRTRARWTLLHFLGVDVESLAPRPTDPASLTQTGNPTMTNPSCTACHVVMDPVAGAFHNYDAGGSYKSAFGGRDSLPDSYKYPADGEPSPYRRGDTWYRDMAAPGFEGDLAPDADNSVQWLARRVVADPRFAAGTVEFWWPAVMGRALSRPPETTWGPVEQGQLVASRAQAGEVERLAAAFRAGIDGGVPYNLRDLLTEMALSPWFRAESVVSDDPMLHAALEYAGAERLLGPEELARKTDSITGYRWGRHTSGYIHEVGNLDGEGFGKGGPYELLYGGIDSDGITRRARSVTPLMAAVAQGHAIRSSCAIVQREFFLWNENQRRLFDGIGADDTPLGSIRGTASSQQGADPRSGRTLIRAKLVDLHWKLFGITVAMDSPDIDAAYRLFVEVWERKRATEGVRFLDSGTQCAIEDTRYFEGILDDVAVTDEWGNSRIDWDRVRDSWDLDMQDPNHTVRTWTVVLAYLMTDYRYLYL